MRALVAGLLVLALGVGRCGSAGEAARPSAPPSTSPAPPASPPAPAPEPPAEGAAAAAGTSPQESRMVKARGLYDSYCGACHTHDVVASQRLDRGGWDWVLDDMIEEYGARWISDEERELLLDFLVQELGPDVPR